MIAKQLRKQWILSCKTTACDLEIQSSAKLVELLWACRPLQPLQIFTLSPMNVTTLSPSLAHISCTTTRFINDGFSTWLHDNEPTTNADNWDNFKNFCSAMGLSWTFSSSPPKTDIHGHDHKN
jgi:hypothetical protein